MIFVLLIGFATAVVLVGSLFRYQEVSDALMEYYPSEFQKGSLWRTAFPIFALNPSTPLHLQVGYSQSQAGLSFVILGISLCCFLLEKEIAGWGLLVAFLVSVVQLIRHWGIYKANRDRKAIDAHEEEL
jgi:hypothetical protein